VVYCSLFVVGCSIKTKFDPSTSSGLALWPGGQGAEKEAPL